MYITHTRTYAHTHIFPLFCISGTTGPIDPKSCMHMECDQTSILHNKIKLIWGHLGYANEGQRSNFPCFVSQEPLVRLSSNFVCIWSVTRQAYYIIRSSWYEAILAMQMKVKGQISLVLYLRNHWSDWAQFCMHMECNQTSILHNKVKLIWGHLGYANEGQRSNLMNFVFKISQKRNEQSSSNFHSIFALMRNGYNNLFSLITQPWRHLGAILGFHFIIHICITIHHKLTKFNTHELPAIV